MYSKPSQEQEDPATGSADSIPDDSKDEGGVQVRGMPEFRQKDQEVQALGLVKRGVFSGPIKEK